MTHIHERRTVQATFEDAAACLERYRDDVAHGGGKIVLSVVVPLERIGIDRRVEISRTVCIRFHPVGSDPRAHRTSISWEPDGGGPFPQFVGEMRIERVDLPGECVLLLDGSYDPPLGVAGELFDAVAGRHIARMSARNLLDEIAIIIETSCTLPTGRTSAAL